MSDTDRGPKDVEREEQIAELVARTLRAEVPVRAAWRAALERDLASVSRRERQASAARTGRRWALRPLTAIAAGLVCAALGAGTTAMVLGRRPRLATETMIGLPASMPLPGERATGSTVRFVLVAPYASHVSLVGDFNRWNPAAMPMRRSEDGRTWTLDVILTAGRHVYSFFVDGDLAPDPAAPRAGDDDFGVPSSVVLVAGRAT